MTVRGRSTADGSCGAPGGDERPQLDALGTAEVVQVLLDAESRVVPAVRAQTQAIAAGAALIANRFRRGGRLAFAGAGTSGRLAAAEAAELPGTFGLPRAQVPFRVAGGAQSSDRDEDDLATARADAAELAFDARDVLVAVAASGRTPYTLELARAAHAAGGTVIAVVNAHHTPLAALADAAIEVQVGPEVLRGSTRLTCGTAQKLALNALTTAAMARLGRVHGDLMIDVEAANAKLRDRAAGIVAEISACSVDRAAAALGECGGNARAAVLRLMFALSPDEAAALAARHSSLRGAIDAARG